MAVRTLSLAELRGLSPSEREERIREFSRGETLNGEVRDLNEKIAAFEARYEMSSGTMRQALADGRLKETADIGRWLMLLSAREDLGISNT